MGSEKLGIELRTEGRHMDLPEMKMKNKIGSMNGLRWV